MSASRAKPGWVASIWKLGVGTLSAGAALVSILSSSSTLKDFVGLPNKEAAIGPEARWAGLTPSTSTATSLGDSIQLAVTVTDARGATLTGITPVWTSTDEGVASVDQGGTVVARGAGVTTIVVSVGRVVARSRIAVRQEAAGIRLGDSLLRIPEGERGQPLAAVVDARGARITGATVAWRTSDAAIVAVDTLNQALGMTPGEATLTAVSGELQAGLRVEVLAVPASVTVVAGEDQRAPAGRPLSTPVTAQVVSRSGRPVSGVPVEFRIQNGQGSCLPAMDTSDVRGTVRTVWTLGEVPGRQHLAIATEGVSVLPVLTAEADPVPAYTRVTLVSEDLTGPVGDTLSQPVLVRVTDSAGVALADVPASWSTPDGGSVVALGSRTDSLGETRARWKLGPKAGRQRIQVQIGNARTMPTLTGRGTGQPGSAASIRVRAGDDQVGTVGALLSRAVVVAAVDRLGNPVPDARLAVVPRNGSVPDSSMRTDSTGQAKLRWTLGRAAGQQRMGVRLESASSGLDLTARARSRNAAKLEFLPFHAALGSGHSLEKSLLVAVTDEFGNSVAERTVRFRSASGSVSPARAVTDAQGQARVRWAPARGSGKRSLIAEVPGTEAKATLTLP
ncbi:MAG: hypothetical protein ACREL3_07945 [Gemmatimonadales bacterium]